jgi:PAS domain-containing protein
MYRLESSQESVIAYEIDQKMDRESNLHSEQIRDLGASLSKAEEDYTALQNELIHLKAELERAVDEKTHLHNKAEKTIEELQHFKNDAEERLRFKEQLLQEAQHSARDQRLLIEKHQQHIANLESKEKDLHYELQTLLQLTSFPGSNASDFSSDMDDNFFQATQPNATAHRYSVPHGTAEGGALQLKRCLDVAAKINGPYYSSIDSSRLSTLSADHYDNYALDLRRLFDSLRDENIYMVIVYSQKENKLLFVNNPVKAILGWAPEKFVQEFAEIIQEDHEAWQHGLNQLAMRREVQLPLKMKSKSGQGVSLECHLGAIHSGPLRHHAIGVFIQPEG